MPTIGYPDDSFHQYLEFVAKFGKTHQSETDFQKKFYTFRDNYKKIVEHNQIPDSGFELEINKFADLTEEEFLEQYTGLKVPRDVT